MANKLCRLLSLHHSPLSVSISQQMRHLSGVSYSATPPQEASRSASPSEKEEKEKVEFKQREETSGDDDGEKGANNSPERWGDEKALSQLAMAIGSRRVVVLISDLSRVLCKINELVHRRSAGIWVMPVLDRAGKMGQQSRLHHGTTRLRHGTFENPCPPRPPTGLALLDYEW